MDGDGLHRVKGNPGTVLSDRVKQAQEVGLGLMRAPKNPGRIDSFRDNCIVFLNSLDYSRVHVRGLIQQEKARVLDTHQNL